MRVKNPDSPLTKPRLSVLTESLLAGEAHWPEAPQAAHRDAATQAPPQAPKSPVNPHKPRPDDPVAHAKSGHGAALDPAALLGEEALIQSMAQWDDPHAQPELPVELMDYTPGALEYTYGRVSNGSLWGPDAGPHYRHVRLNLSKDGALGAALAAVAASSPTHIQSLIRAHRDKPGLYQGKLHSRSTAATYKLRVDDCVPVRRDGAPMGHSSAPLGPAPLWHLLLAKMFAKLDQVLMQVNGANMNIEALGPQHALADIGAFLQTLTGSPVFRAARDRRMVPGTVLPWHTALRTLLQGKPGHVAAVTFRDTQGMGRMECDDGVLTNAFGGLGMHVHNADTNVILLSKHHYAVVAVDRAQQRVALYNPLGWNPDPQALRGNTRAAQFMAPEQLDALPKTHGTFWVSNSLLARIGLTLASCDLPS